MTRLIDADAIPYRDIWREDWLHNAGKYQQGVFRDEIEEMPTIDAVPVVHGKWIYGNDFHWYTASCNKCGYQRRTDIKAEGWNQWKFCPNCGARMDKE